MDTHHTLHGILELLVTTIQVIGIVVMLWGVALFVKNFLILMFKKFERPTAWQKAQRLRIQLGTFILIALELMIVADIIETVSKQSLTSLAMLAGIVIIRTTISYFLGKEIEEAGRYLEPNETS